jgi:hypothetical protein
MFKDSKYLSYSKYDHEDTTLGFIQCSTEIILETIETSSPFNSTYIKNELAKLNKTGTCIIVYGYRDLVFKESKENLKAENICLENLLETGSCIEDLDEVKNDLYIKKVKLFTL